MRKIKVKYSSLINLTSTKKRNFAFIDAEISHDGKVCSTCEMVYCTFSKEIAKNDFQFYGCFLEEGQNGL